VSLSFSNNRELQERTMFSLIRDVLMPAAPALALIAALVMAPSARAEEGQGEEKIATAAVAVLAAQPIPARGGTVPADSGRRAAGAGEMESDTTDARPCRRIDRIGKVTIRRCR
jgi:hypothetical protein